MIISNLEKYNQIFVENFAVTLDVLSSTFTYQCVPEWDSVGHMAMIAAIEDEFDIMLDTDDVIEFSSYSVGIGLLEKYGVDF
jgi:acyl carrier protein